MTTEQNKSPPSHIPLDAQHYELIERCNALRDTNVELLASLEDVICADTPDINLTNGQSPGTPAHDRDRSAKGNFDRGLAHRHARIGDSMTPTDSRATRKRLGLSIDAMAECLRLKDGRSVRRYEDGSREIIGPITLCIEYMLKYSPLP
jgi:hypothetical protein